MHDYLQSLVTLDGIEPPSGPRLYDPDRPSCAILPVCPGCHALLTSALPPCSPYGGAGLSLQSVLRKKKEGDSHACSSRVESGAGFEPAAFRLCQTVHIRMCFPLISIHLCHSEPVRTLAWESVLQGYGIWIATPAFGLVRNDSSGVGEENSNSPYSVVVRTAD